MNCPLTTLTYDMRRRGYDVIAPGTGGRTDSEIQNYYKMDPHEKCYIYVTTPEYMKANRELGWKHSKQYDVAKIKHDITAHNPDGAYGHLTVVWKDGGGHDCVWIKKNGKVFIEDAQVNRYVPIEDYLGKSVSCTWFRADDKELTEAAFNEYRNDPEDLNKIRRSA